MCLKLCKVRPGGVNPRLRQSRGIRFTGRLSRKRGTTEVTITAAFPQYPQPALGIEGYWATIVPRCALYPKNPELLGDFHCGRNNDVNRYAQDVTVSEAGELEGYFCVDFLFQR